MTNNVADGMHRMTIDLPIGVYRRLKAIATEDDRAPGTLARRMLTACVDDALPPE